MTDTVYRELDLPCSPSEAWEQVTDPSWLGDDGELPTTPGADGWISEGDDVRYLIVEEVDEENRLVYRWATFAEEPSRVEIELTPIPAGTRITISESPIEARARASLVLR
ncbi:MAG: SRPBCC domain-containing protein [Acidimicrobiales bacterium]|jgi:uncharacterized protein YndB with AHSA1/START domain